MSAHLERLIRIYNRLRRGPVTIDIISKWVQNAGISVSDRQLYRDLHQLVNLKIAEGENVVEYIDEKNRKTWKLEYDEASEKITQYDINSFFLLKNFAPFAILEQRKSSIEKFEKIIYRKSSKNSYQKLIEAGELYMRRTNFFDQMYGAIEHEQIEDLVWALHNKRIVIIESITINPANIHFDGHKLPIKLYPLEMIFHRGRALISGICCDDNKVMTFAIDPDFKFSLTNETFNRKKIQGDYYQKIESLFGISDPLDEKVYDIEVEFTAGYGRSWMNYFWHRSQKWQRLDSGNYMLHLRCSIGRELIGFLAYGLDKTKVHRPKVLKDLMLKKLQRTASINLLDLPIDEETANKDY